ncbi:MULTISPECIES: hypothetical protein [unclassified Sporosarcina]|uniref:hypothetical protein n=1 Tax=unclassified Sporosarcina TaxID=2647733 RepID=UPI00203BD4A4|nr:MULTISPECIES: hypothetical protein [unclassified Sporosarcina]
MARCGERLGWLVQRMFWCGWALVWRVRGSYWFASFAVWRGLKAVFGALAGRRQLEFSSPCTAYDHLKWLYEHNVGSNDHLTGPIERQTVRYEQITEFHDHPGPPYDHPAKISSGKKSRP